MLLLNYHTSSGVPLIFFFFIYLTVFMFFFCFYFLGTEYFGTFVYCQSLHLLWHFLSLFFAFFLICNKTLDTFLKFSMKHTSTNSTESSTAASE